MSAAAITAVQRAISLLAGALVVALLLAPSLALAEPAGSVIALSGQCFVESQGRRTALKLRDTVNVADTIDVPADGKLKLRMSDGTILSLAAATRMSIAAYRSDPSGQRQDAQLTLPQGLIRAVVAPVEKPAKFEVSTAVGVAAVRSTDWFVEAKPGDMQIGVLSGSVSMRSAATGRAVTVPARWGARLEAGRDPVQARGWTPAEFQAVIGRTDVN